MKKLSLRVIFILIVLLIGLFIFTWTFMVGYPSHREAKKSIEQIKQDNFILIGDFLFLIIFSLWNFLPYLVFAIVSYFLIKNYVPLILSATLLVVFDLYIHGRVFLWSSHSTDAIAPIVSPIYLLLLIFAGWGIGYLVVFIMNSVRKNKNKEN